VNVLYLNHNVAWSGTFFRAYHFARQLVARGHTVTLVTTHRSSRWSVFEEVRDGVRLLQMPDLFSGPARTGWDPWNVVRRIVALHSGRYDVIHAFDSRPAVILPALAVQQRRGGVLFTDWADWWGRGGTIRERSTWIVRSFFGPIEAWFEEAFRGRAMGTTVISSALAQRAAGLGIPAERIFLVPQGSDVQGIHPIPRVVARAHLCIEPGAMVLVHLGAMLPPDAAMLFAALRLVRASGLPVRLVLVGNPRVAAPSDLPPDVCQQTGFVPFDEMQWWLAAADACVIPLRDTIGNRARWPSRINDYFAAGRPVVMTGVGDAARYVREEDAGWVCGATAPALADSIGWAFSNVVARERAGERARTVAEGRLAWRKLAAGLDRFYGDMLSGVPPTQRGLQSALGGTA
jgi:glycosyltransferase involved in cell wall biosynthesis